MLDQPLELVRTDLVARRVSGLDVGSRQQFKATAREPTVAGPGVNQPPVDFFSLGPEDLKAM
jgi:hypothetical protein